MNGVYTEDYSTPPDVVLHPGSEMESDEIMNLHKITHNTEFCEWKGKYIFCKIITFFA